MAQPVSANHGAPIFTYKTMEKKTNQTEALKFQHYYETWLATHGQQAAAGWLAATAGTLSARVSLLEKQIKTIERIVKRSKAKP